MLHIINAQEKLILDGLTFELECAISIKSLRLQTFVSLPQQVSTNSHIRANK